MAFNYGRPVFDASFVNRKQEIERLQHNIDSGINTVMISPRRWGKSSLVRHVIHLNATKTIVFCELDLFKVRTEEQFFSYFATELILATDSTVEAVMASIKKWLGRFTPSITFSSGEEGHIKVRLEPKAIEQSRSEVLDLPEQIAKDKGIHLVVCIDEFQNIEAFSDPMSFQKEARAHWQHHQHVTYVLYGSKRHMLTQLFERKNMPFYKFGDVMYLGKIGPEHFVPFIVRGFADAGKSIGEEVAATLVEKMDNHPYYVQQLAHILLYSASKKKVGMKALDRAVEQLILTNAIFYTKEFDDLPETQILFLQMLLTGAQSGFTKKTTLQQFGFASSAHVVAAQRALEKKEIIETFGGKVEFVDPVFPLWLEQTFAS